MISISRYSKTMYVVRGSMDGIKDTLKSYGMKWVRKLKGGPGYVLYVNSRTGLSNLYAIKRLIRESNNNNRPSVPENTSTCGFNNRSSLLVNPFPFTYTDIYWCVVLWCCLFATHILFCVYLLLIDRIIYSYIFITNMITYNMYYICMYIFNTIYMAVSTVEYSELKFTLIYPVIKFPMISVDYNLTYWDN
jgi:hypothetical protein